MADAAARSLQYEYKAVRIKGLLFFWLARLRSHFTYGMVRVFSGIATRYVVIGNWSLVGTDFDNFSFGYL